jgi:hypothetical protein
MNNPAKQQPRLTDKQKRLADLWMKAKVEGANFTTADLAEAAGYQGTKEALYVSASRTLALPYVREYLHSKARDHLRDGAVDVAITLRALSTGAQSERVRADTAARLAAGLGLIDGERPDSGPGVAIQIVFQTQAGAVLAQPIGAVIEGQANQGIDAPAHSLAEGGRGRKPRRKTPSPGPTQDARAAPGVKNRARRLAAGSPSRRSVSEVVGDFSGVVDGDE